MNVNLPNGWQRLTLADVLVKLPAGSQVQQGWSPQCEKRPAADDEWGVLKTTAIQPGAFLPEHNKRLPDHLSPRAGLEVAEGDLLLTNAGPRSRCAIPCLVRRTRPRLMLSGKFYRFRPQSDLVDPRFLELYLLSPDAQTALDVMKTGISDSGLNLTRERFLALAVPVPRLDEQRRIVEVLEDHLSRLDAGARGLSAAARRLHVLAAAAAERAKRDVEASTQSSQLSSLAIDASYGTSTKCVLGGAGPAVVRIPNLVGGKVDLVKEKRVADPSFDVSSAMLKPGDLLVVRTNGSRQLIGRTAVVQPGIDAAFASYLIRYRLDPTRVRPQWVHLMMQAPSTRALLESMAASSAGQYNLSLGKLDSLDLPIPPLENQDALLSEHRALREATERFASEVEAATMRADVLRHALLTAAFSGRLT